MSFKVEWLNIENCEYPHIDIGESDCADVWIINYDGNVEHGIYKNPRMDECYFTSIDGEILDGVTQWATFITPDGPQ